MIQTIVENVGLTLFAEMGLVLFVIVFIAVVLNAVRRPRSEIEQLSQMALEEDELEHVALQGSAASVVHDRKDSME